MKQELQEKLFRHFPEIFVGRHKTLQESLMPFGIECGDGWEPLIRALCEYIDFQVLKNGVPPVEAVQVKEKFGTLCFYIRGGNERIHEVIHFAEYLSGKTCEWCGQPGILRRDHPWIRTLCDLCEIKYQSGLRE